MLEVSSFKLLLMGCTLYVCLCARLCSFLTFSSHVKLQKGELYLLTIELRDPNVHAIEFVLKDGSRERWFGFFLLLHLVTCFV